LNFITKASPVDPFDIAPSSSPWKLPATTTDPSLSTATLVPSWNLSLP
jgi:hypothetical protein